MEKRFPFVERDHFAAYITNERRFASVTFAPLAHGRAAGYARAMTRNGPDLFSFLIPLALAAVLVSLAFGLYALFRGGDFGRSWSNKLMRLRVLAQFIAVLVLCAAAWWRAKAG